jgi:hypothetical protein
MKLLAMQIGAASVVALVALAGTGRAAPYAAPSVSAAASASADAARSASAQSRAAAASAVRDIRDRLQAERRGEARFCGPRTLVDRTACARAAYGRAYYR